MARIILARENDKGNKSQNILLLFAISIIGAFGGLIVGWILGSIAQRILNSRSPLLDYGVQFASVIIGIIIAILYCKSDLNTKNHTVCEKCHAKMSPMTVADTLFSIPVKSDQTYQEPFFFLTKNMLRISSIREISAGQRGCYTCCYTCNNCSHRIVRIADFTPVQGTCQWNNSYYFDFTQFVQARGKNDLL